MLFSLHSLLSPVKTILTPTYIAKWHPITRSPHYLVHQRLNSSIFCSTVSNGIFNHCKILLTIPCKKLLTMVSCPLGFYCVVTLLYRAVIDHVYYILFLRNILYVRYPHEQWSLAIFSQTIPAATNNNSAKDDYKSIIGNGLNTIAFVIAVLASLRRFFFCAICAIPMSFHSFRIVYRTFL